MNDECHYCKNCTNTHRTDKGIPNAYCTLREKSVIEFHMTCNEFKPKRKAKKAA